MFLLCLYSLSFLITCLFCLRSLFISVTQVFVTCPIWFTYCLLTCFIVWKFVYFVLFIITFLLLLVYNWLVFFCLPRIITSCCFMLQYFSLSMFVFVTSIFLLIFLCRTLKFILEFHSTAFLSSNFACLASFPDFCLLNFLLCSQQYLSSYTFWIVI
jgi:hypothetical protein